MDVLQSSQYVLLTVVSFSCLASLCIVSASRAWTT
jgi:hypothetical protein